MAAQLCIVDYRVAESEFDAALEFYCKLVGKQVSDCSYNQGGRARLEVFSVVNEEETGRYNCELRVTVVPVGGGGEYRHCPVIYWGTDDVEGDYERLLKNTPPKPDDEAYQEDPIRHSTHGSMALPPFIASAVDSYFNRSGDAPNPTFPPFVPPHG